MLLALDDFTKVKFDNRIPTGIYIDKEKSEDRNINIILENAKTILRYCGWEAEIELNEIFPWNKSNYIDGRIKIIEPPLPEPPKPEFVPGTTIEHLKDANDMVGKVVKSIVYDYNGLLIRFTDDAVIKFLARENYDMTEIDIEANKIYNNELVELGFMTKEEANRLNEEQKKKDEIQRKIEYEQREREMYERLRKKYGKTMD